MAEGLRRAIVAGLMTGLLATPVWAHSVSQVRAEQEPGQVTAAERDEAHREAEQDARDREQEKRDREETARGRKLGGWTWRRGVSQDKCSSRLAGGKGTGAQAGEAVCCAPRVSFFQC